MTSLPRQIAVKGTCNGIKIQFCVWVQSIWSHYYYDWLHGMPAECTRSQFISASRRCRGLPYDRLLACLHTGSVTCYRWFLWLAQQPQHHWCYVHKARLCIQCAAAVQTTLCAAFYSAVHPLNLCTIGLAVNEAQIPRWFQWLVTLHDHVSHQHPVLLCSAFLALECRPTLYNFQVSSWHHVWR